MKINNGNLPAMPNNTNPKTLGCMGLMDTVASFYKHGAGLTKREMFAMAAMQGLCANSIAGSHHGFKELTSEAVTYADALLAELEKTK